MDTRDDEFAEFDMDEARFDAIMERGTPAELVSGPPLTTHVHVSAAGFAITQNVTIGRGVRVEAFSGTISSVQNVA